jgi:hypothetical protein
MRLKEHISLAFSKEYSFPLLSSPGNFPVTHSQRVIQVTHLVSTKVDGLLQQCLNSHRESWVWEVDR